MNDTINTRRVIKELTKYADFADELNELYELRKKATGEDIEKIDEQIKDLAKNNEKFFDKEYMDKLEATDKETFDFLSAKFNVQVLTPEAFYESIKKEDNRPYKDYTDDQIQQRLNLLWNVAINSGEMDVIDKDSVEYHGLLDELRYRRSLTNTDDKVEDDTKDVTKDEVVEDNKVQQIVNPTYEEAYGKKEEPKWDPRLTEEQILDAKSRDIYEPVGIEYEQFLSDLGLKPIKKEEVTDKAPEEDRPYKDLSDEEIKRRINNLWNISINSGEFENDDKEVKEYHDLLAELNRRKVQVKKDDEPTKDAPKVEDTTPAPIVTPSTPVPAPAPIKADDATDDATDTTDDADKDKDDDKIDMPKRADDDSEEVFTLDSILYELTEGIDLTKGGRKALVNSELRVVKGIKNKFKQNNNWIYNISYVVPSVVTGLFGGVKKVSGSLYKLTHPKKAADLQEVRDRIKNLPKEKMEILRTQYDLGRANENSGNAAIAPIIYEGLTNYVETEYCQPTRNKLTELYLDIAHRYRAVQALLLEVETTEDEKEKEEKQKQIALLAKGSTKKIEEIEKLRIELSHNYNDGLGMTSLSTAYGAVDNNSNRRGRAFARKYSTKDASNFNAMLSGLSKIRAVNIKGNKDLGSLIAFGDEENYKISETAEKKSLYGKRSVGIYNYNPIPHQEEIGPDPLLGYIMRTIATVGIAKGIISEIQNQFVLAPQLRDANDAIVNYNSQIGQINQNNLSTVQSVQAIGSSLQSKFGDFKAGLRNIGREGVLAKHSGGEHATIGLDNGNFGTNYHAFDPVNHQETHQLMDDLNNTLQNVDNGLANGSMSQADALTAIGHQLDAIQAAKRNVYNMYQDVLNNSTNPQRFDYDAFYDYIPKVMQDTSLTNMVDAMVESIKAGESLKTAVAQFIEPLTVEIPTHVHSFIIPLLTEIGLLGYLESVTKNAVSLYKNDENVEKIIKYFTDGLGIRYQLEMVYMSKENPEVIDKDEEEVKGLGSR